MPNECQREPFVSSSRIIVMSAEELQQSDNKEKVTELFGNGTVVDSSPNDLELADKSDLKKSHDESAGSAAVARSSFTVDESPKIKSSHALCTYLKNTAILVWIERVFVISICIAVAIGFTVPIIIYAADTDRGSDNSTLSIDLNVDNCPSFDMQVRHYGLFIFYYCVTSHVIDYIAIHMQGTIRSQILLVFVT